MIQHDGVADSLLYTYSDAQGSLIALADVNGNVVERYAYDPWGARRNPDDWTQKDSRTKWITNRGYTGHEHLDAFGIINMNGRVYDPLTAQFFSPDPCLQSPGDWLNYNRYGYCMGNPFKYTDPSGNSWLSSAFMWVTGAIGDVLTVVVRAVVATAVLSIAAPLAVAATVVSTAVGLGKGVFTGNWNILNNDIKIIGGLFTGSTKQILSRLTWELPQTMAGYLASQGSNMIGDVKSVSYYDGATVVEHNSNNWGAFTLGSYINGDRTIEANPTNQLFQHEYGHYLQSQDYGWGYLTKDAIPSLFNIMTNPKGTDNGYYEHVYYSVEQDANRRGMNYFGDSVWKYRSNPIYGSGKNDDLDNEYGKYYTQR